MLTRRRVLTGVAVLLVAAIAWTIWLSVKTADDLRRAEASADELRSALESGDLAAREAALADFQEASASAQGRTDGAWWGLMTLAPAVGDDAAGVRALSESLALVADDVISPLADVLDTVEGDVLVDGQVDLERLVALQQPVASARASLTTASDLVADEDSSGYMSALRSRYDDYTDIVTDLKRSLGTAETAVDLLPDMLGREGPRDYLLIFQNNAEIRATGGLPGSWAELHVEDGKLSLGTQGAATDFPVYPKPVVSLTSGESAAFGTQMGRYFQDPNFTPDFPRAAEVFNGFWAGKYPDEPLDGVVAVDVVGLSYLLRGLGPVHLADGSILTSDNAVQLLLSDVYKNVDNEKRDAIFASAARSIFEAVTAGPANPTAFVEALGTATGEGRLLVAPFDPSEAAMLADTRIGGALTDDDGAVPHVDLALNDLTAAKMSYYLRYGVDIEAAGCADGVQTLRATATVSQTITRGEARALPDYVVGAGFGFKPGEQAVRMHIIGPYDGTINDIRFDGERVVLPKRQAMLGGRPITTATVYLESTKPVVLTWTMTTGPGQTADAALGVTPSIEPGDNRQATETAC